MNVIKIGREAAKEQLHNKRTTMRKNEAATVLEFTKNWLEGKRVFSMVELDFLVDITHTTLQRCGVDDKLRKDVPVACLKAFAALYQRFFSKEQNDGLISEYDEAKLLRYFYHECCEDSEGSKVTPDIAALNQIKFLENEVFINQASAVTFSLSLAALFSEHILRPGLDRTGTECSYIIKDEIPVMLQAMIAGQEDSRDTFIQAFYEQKANIKIEKGSVKNDLCKACIPMYGDTIPSGLAVKVNMEIGENAEMSFLASDPGRINYLEDMFERMLSKDELSPFFCNDSRWDWCSLGLHPDDSVHINMRGLSIWVPREKIMAAIDAFRELMDQPDVQEAREKLKWVYGRI